MTEQPSNSGNGKPPFLERINESPVIFDGGMGTMIYERGVFLNVCYDELCLTRPDLIYGIHKEYVVAGAEVIEANTFGANRIKLALHGLEDQLEAINRAGVQLARKAAGNRVYVAASVGPCIAKEDDATDIDLRNVEDAYAEQFAIFASENVDLLVLETFDDVEQLLMAARIAKQLKLPVLASFSVMPSKEPVDELLAPEVLNAQRLEADPNVDIIGINCRLGPADMFYPVKRIIPHIRKPLVVMPNAGTPAEVGGRMLYMNSPEYFTEFSKRFIELGVKGIGGCCGTTPAHIKMAAQAIQSLDGVKRYITIEDRDPDVTIEELPPIPTAEKSSFGAKMLTTQHVRMIEILPPTTGGGLEKFLEKCRQCQDAGIDAINMPDGPRASARMSVMSTALAIKNKLDIEPVPHYCCRDRSLIGMQSDLLGGFALGLSTWLLITGDPPKLGKYPTSTGVFDLDAIGVTQLVSNLNRGLDAVGQPITQRTGILIGVGANPEAVDLDREIDRFFKKIDAGAEYAVTQPIFDADSLLRFIELTGKYHRTIPIVAGLYPLVSFKNAQFMSQHVPGVVVPDKVLERMHRCENKEAAVAEGLAIVLEIRNKVADVVAGFQASAPLGLTDIAIAALQ